MRKIKMKKKRGQLRLYNRLLKFETVNTRELRLINNQTIERLLPIQQMQKKQKITFCVEVAGLSPLATVFRNRISQVQFLNIVYQLITQIRQCDQNSVNINNLLLDKRYIFINPSTEHIYTILLPIINNQDLPSIKTFFKDLPKEVSFSSFETQDYLVEYQAFFLQDAPFSTRLFEQLIMKLLGKSEPEKSRVPSGFLNQPAQSSNRQFYQAPARTNGKRICPSCQGENSAETHFCGFCGLNLASVNRENDYTQQALSAYAPEENYSHGTTVLGVEAEKSDGHLPYLICNSTQEKVEIKQSVFRLGKKASQTDYTVQHNSAVSQLHAEIISRNGSYYLVDQNSTNHTYVNGQIIPPMTEVEIRNQTEFVLGNEVFVFYE